MRRMRESFLNPKTRDGQVLIGVVVLAVVGLFVLRNWNQLTRKDAVAETPAAERAIEAESATPPDSVVAAETIADRKPSSVGATILTTGVDASGQCVSIEFRGRGPQGRGWTDSEWKSVVTLFEKSRGELRTWLKKQKNGVTERAREVMESQIASLKVERPANDEPDLAWRGTAVWNFDAKGTSVVRVGEGFAQMIKNQPKRAAFEMTRAIAQTWAPCELVRLNTPHPWIGALKCLGVTEQESCGVGSFSDAGWAVSTVVAKQVANPGCTIPALAGADVTQCLGNGIPVAASNSANGTTSSSASNLATGSASNLATDSTSNPATGSTSNSASLRASTLWTAASAKTAALAAGAR